MTVTVERATTVLATSATGTTTMTVTTIRTRTTTTKVMIKSVHYGAPLPPETERDAQDFALWRIAG